MWEAKNLKKDNKLRGMDFLLFDEKENTIQYFVYHSLLAKFGKQLCEGSFIEICNFNLQDCNKSYRDFDHKFLIRFNETIRTTVFSNIFSGISLPKLQKFCQTK